MRQFDWTDELTDNQGHYWTRREILSLGVDGFERRYAGNYRRAIRLFGEVAKEGKLEEAKRLSKPHRQRFHELEKAFVRLEASWSQVVRQTSGAGGTALLAVLMKIYASREDFLRQVALCWETPGRNSNAEWQRGIQQLRTRGEVMVALNVLENLRPGLPPIVVLCCARRFHYLTTVPRSWVG